MRGDEMDDLHASLTAELASGRMTLPVTMEMTLVARLYERLGAHAVNVARRVIYLAGSGQAGPLGDKLSAVPVARQDLRQGFHAPAHGRPPALASLPRHASAYPAEARTV
jgi:hypothetical protein